MKNEKAKYLKRLFGLTVICLALLFFRVPAQSATNCVTASGALDSDCDGISDVEEASPVAGVTTSPALADLFVVLGPVSSGSLLPGSPLNILMTSAASIGLNVHQIANNQILPNTARNVTASQKAVRVVESLYVGSYLGVSPQGTPDTTPDTGASVVYTQTITNTVTGLCTPPKGKALICNDADGITSGQQAVIDKYIRHTIAHETGHQLNLKYTCATDIGCHYPAITSAGQLPSIMDQSVYYVKGTGKITWYIGSRYNATDADFQLIP